MTTNQEVAGNAARHILGQEVKQTETKQYEQWAKDISQSGFLYCSPTSAQKQQ